MSDPVKETPAADASIPSESATAIPVQVDAATTLDAAKHATASVANTVTDKATKIFGSFTPTDTPTKAVESKESTPSVKPLFGGFGGASGASPWAAPTTVGGFASASSFTPQKAEEAAEVVRMIIGADGRMVLLEMMLLRVQRSILNPLSNLRKSSP